MGVDAMMFVKVKGKDNWRSPADVHKLAVRLAVTIGPDAFMITLAWDHSFGTPHHALSIVEPFVDHDGDYEDEPEIVGKVVWLQDGDTIIAADDEQFIKVHLYDRYYGDGYERGDWPQLRAIMECLEYLIPDGEIWYGGDSSGICAEHFHKARREEMNRHFLERQGRLDYVSYELPQFPKRKNDCPHCHIPKTNCGGGPDNRDFLWCPGCGTKTIMIGGATYIVPRHENFSGQSPDKMQVESA